jgi:two-component system, OmpR family, response regulator CpxR
MSLTEKVTAVSAGLSVLVVDDDVELCQLLSQYLAAEGYAVEAVHTGHLGVERARSGEHALVVLDVMLPDIKGFEVLRRVRAHSSLPILMLTARGDEQDRILGLQMGADDYLPKPFNPRELSARIEAVLRRTRHDGAIIEPRTTAPIVVDDVSLDRGARVATRSGAEVDLTTVEFDLLVVLLQWAGRVIPRDEMVRTVLRREFSPFDRSIDTHVSNLRRKLGPTPDGADRIKGVRGIGYQYTVRHRAGRETS